MKNFHKSQTTERVNSKRRREIAKKKKNAIINANFIV